MNVFISQKDNFAQNFGIVLRSSAIFYYKYSSQVKTTISFMDYWRQKRGIIVTVIATIRESTGKLIGREELIFNQGTVINYSPRIDTLQEFEGSVEIEVFSTQNLVIPYAAIMAVYETPKGISMVHSYSRTYSQHEIEERKTITQGEEACWTLRDTELVRSFCVFHNGGKTQSAQKAILRVIGPNNQIREATIELGELQPYATVKVYPSDHIQGLAEWLKGEYGNASISFKVEDAFTRLLIGNETVDGSDLQVTHSNFNYSIHKTDSIDSNDAMAYMHIPGCSVDEKETIIYPESDPGEYKVTYMQIEREFKTGEPVVIPVKDGVMTFTKNGGYLPTRLVTGLICENPNGLLPAETSLGVITKLRPPKRMWWCICASDEERKTSLIIHDIPEVYGRGPISLSIRLFSGKRQGFIEKKYDNALCIDFSNGVDISEIFPQAREYLDNEFGYVTIFSEYGGLYCYTMIKNLQGSHTLEHGF
ncbi:hypothetical protein ACI7RC_04200 [Brevibacillus sp. B_LB10_24]|uniref:hypothetical protein n=1 Tax=Brevibacillus sp. B_LB10_24 TaxID=3380645 RepID=UPI0038B8D5B3